MRQYYSLVSSGSSPVTLAEVKEYLSILNTAHDSVLTKLIDACTEYAECYLWLALRTNQWHLFIDRFDSCINLLRPPVSSIDDISYLKDAVLTAVDPQTYYLRKSKNNPQIILSNSKAWPTDVDIIANAIRITFTTSTEIFNSKISNTIKKHVAKAFKFRGDCEYNSANIIKEIKEEYDLAGRIPRI